MVLYIERQEYRTVTDRIIQMPGWIIRIWARDYYSAQFSDTLNRFTL